MKSQPRQSWNQLFSDRDVPRALLEVQAVGEELGAVAAAAELAVADEDVARVRDVDGGAEASVRRGDEHVVQLDVLRAVDLEPAVVGDGLDRHPLHGHVLGVVEQQALHDDSALPDDPEPPRGAGGDDELAAVHVPP